MRILMTFLLLLSSKIFAMGAQDYAPTEVDLEKLHPNTTARECTVRDEVYMRNSVGALNLELNMKLDTQKSKEFYSDYLVGEREGKSLTCEELQAKLEELTTWISNDFSQADAKILPKNTRLSIVKHACSTRNSYAKVCIKKGHVGMSTNGVSQDFYLEISADATSADLLKVLRNRAEGVSFRDMVPKTN